MIFLKSESVELLSPINFDCYYYYFLLLNFWRSTNSSIHDLSNKFFYPTPQLSSLIPPSTLGEDFFFFFFWDFYRDSKLKLMHSDIISPKLQRKCFSHPGGVANALEIFWIGWSFYSLLAATGPIECLYLCWFIIRSSAFICFCKYACWRAKQDQMNVFKKKKVEINTEMTEIKLSVVKKKVIINIFSL